MWSAFRAAHTPVAGSPSTSTPGLLGATLSPFPAQPTLTFWVAPTPAQHLALGPAQPREVPVGTVKPSVTPQWGLTNQGVVLVTLVVQLSSWGAPSRGVCPSEGASMPAWWLGSSWVPQGEVWDHVQLIPVGWLGTHVTRGTALQARLHWERSTGRASAQVDTEKLNIVTNGELMDIAQVGQVTPDSTQGMGRVPTKRTGDEVADKRMTTGASCVLGHGRRKARSTRDGAVPCWVPRRARLGAASPPPCSCQRAAAAKSGSEIARGRQGRQGWGHRGPGAALP